MYEPRYPRTPRVRWRYVLAKCGQGAVSLVLAYAVFRQFVLPVLRESTAPPPPSPSPAAQPAGPLAALAAAALSLSAAQVSACKSAIEGAWACVLSRSNASRKSLPPARSLLLSQARLAVPTLGVWLLLYLAAFHCGLNALAEVGASEQERERYRERGGERAQAQYERSVECSPGLPRALPRPPARPPAQVLRFADRQFSLEWRVPPPARARDRERERDRASAHAVTATCECAARLALPSSLSHAPRARSPRRWNATSLRSFWRRWNVPVHEWCLRHLFLELQHYGGLPHGAAVGLTFLASGVLHELVFGLAFRCVRPWFLLGMLAQASGRTRARDRSAGRTRLARLLARSLARSLHALTSLHRPPLPIAAAAAHRALAGARAGHARAAPRQPRRVGLAACWAAAAAAALLSRVGAAQRGQRRLFLPHGAAVSAASAPGSRAGLARLLPGLARPLSLHLLSLCCTQLFARQSACREASRSRAHGLGLNRGRARLVALRAQHGRELAR